MAQSHGSIAVNFRRRFRHVSFSALLSIVAAFINAFISLFTGFFDIPAILQLIRASFPCPNLDTS